MEYFKYKWQWVIIFKDGSEYGLESYVIDRFRPLSEKELIDLERFVRKYDIPF